LFHYPVVGITGSNGKTIIKEWLGQLLASEFRIVKSPASYNSQLGVPLSILQMTDQHTLGVFEAGISLPDEMNKLQSIIHPTYGIFTNLGSAHDEGFENASQKAHEKWTLFKDSKKVIYCIDHELVASTKPANISGFTWGKGSGVDVQLIQNEKKDGNSELGLLVQGNVINIRLPFQDDASVENAMHCITMMFFLGLSGDLIAMALPKLSKIDMRLSLKKGVNNGYLIDDSYNNDLGGLQVAMDFLRLQLGTRKRIILSDILQSGQDEKALYAQLATIISENHVEKMVGIGEAMVRQRAQFQVSAEFFKSTDDFLKNLNTEKYSNVTILIKGARAFEFERITNALSEKLHRTVLEINLEALNANLNFYRRQLKKDVKLMVMVKASAYGSGSYEVANLLQFNRVNYLTVAYPDEGVELRTHGINIPIMVMNVVQESFQNLLTHHLEPEIFSLGQLKALIRFLSEKEAPIDIHIKIDSGMHRLGFEEKDLPELVHLLQSRPQIRVLSVYSHLAGADDASFDYFSHEQVQRFSAMADMLDAGLNYRPWRHILNSAGILRFPEYQMDMVRLGIGLYGFEANQMAQDELRPISTLKTIVSQVRQVRAGESVGYSRKGRPDRDSTIATIAIGYADGFSRAFSNGNISLFIHGKPAKVIGNVCMDMTMLDVTGLDVHEGDEVIVFGEKPSIKELADAIGTIPYEILTSISSRVTRVFYSG